MIRDLLNLGQLPSWFHRQNAAILQVEHGGAPHASIWLRGPAVHHWLTGRAACHGTPPFATDWWRRTGITWQAALATNQQSSMGVAAILPAAIWVGRPSSPFPAAGCCSVLRTAKFFFISNLGARGGHRIRRCCSISWTMLNFTTSTKSFWFWVGPYLRPAILVFPD